MKEMRRSCGVLLPISALPSPYGIGTLGKAAYDFVDFLTEAGQSWWQLLPVGPTSYGDSPYQSFSTYAGNPYFVDLDLLVRDGLLKKEEIEARDWGRDPSRVDYAAIYRSRFQLLQIAADRGWERDADKVKAFSEKNAGWLPDYALFMALKRHFDMRAWTQWEDEDIRLRRPAAVERYQRELSEDIRLFTYIQYLFFRQWEALRTYAHKKGIGMIGDLPIYVAMDSADVWAEPDSFQLDERNIPKEVAGVPPDYFSEDGQLWGNPLYDWAHHRATGYAWWVRRVRHALALYDEIRIDHFRAFDTYYAIPAGAATARDGVWEQGPGMELFEALRRELGQVPIVAEDLGLLFDSVRRLLKASGLPGMKVLQFAFDPDCDSEYLPHNHPENCVVYPGTHDNATAAEWLATAGKKELAKARAYLGLTKEEGEVKGFLRGALASPARLAVIPAADWLGLGAEGRINTPGTSAGNWQWRAKPGAFSPALAGAIRRQCAVYGRGPAAE